VSLCVFRAPLIALERLSYLQRLFAVMPIKAKVVAQHLSEITLKPKSPMI
jgi:hypothetical protein